MTFKRLVDVLTKNEALILNQWKSDLKRVLRRDLMSETEINQEAGDFFRQFLQATRTENLGLVKDLLSSLSRSRGLKGFTPSETAAFVLTLKKPIFDMIRKEFAQDTEALGEELWNVTEMIDQLALHTTEMFQKSREEVIARQQADMLELSTPVVELWDNILALPMIGTLDSSRTQVVMETLLQRIVETGSEIAIIDITGVPTVDTLVAQHLLKTVTAARLMGAECIISGIRPQIAATIVHLGVDLGNVVTKASLADAFKLALHKTGQAISSKANRA